MTLNKLLITIFFITTLFLKTQAQSFNVDFLFNPSITLGTEYIPSSTINDSTNFTFIKHKAQFVLPLKTKFGVKGLKLKNFSFKKLDAKASQLFLTSNLNIIKPTANKSNNFSTIYAGNIGFTALTASIKKGIWLYAANINFAENSTTIIKSSMPNFSGYIAKIKVKSLKFAYFYGISLTTNQGKIYPLPIFGVRQKFNKKLSASLVFPVQVKLIYKASKNIKINLATNFDGINTIYRVGSVIKNNDNSINYRQLKTYLGVNTKINTHFKLYFEAGYASFRKFTAISTDYAASINPAYYLSFSINYRFGKSVFNNFLNNVQ